MTDNQDLLEFVREHVRSVWGVELLLLLKSDPGRRWTAPELVRELRASTTLVNDNLQRFERSGLVTAEEPSRYRYDPAGAVLSELCDRLEAAYRVRPVSVINMIATAPNPLQTLADAFKFRGDDT